jgi:hypothetical protein
MSPGIIDGFCERSAVGPCSGGSIIFLIALPFSRCCVWSSFTSDSAIKPGQSVP